MIYRSSGFKLKSDSTTVAANVEDVIAVALNANGRRNEDVTEMSVFDSTDKFQAHPFYEKFLEQTTNLN